MIPLREQIAQLKTATAGLTQEERNRHLVTLYGQNSLSGMLALLDAGPEKLDKMTNALINSDGAAREMAETMQDNLASKIEQMGGAFESAAIVIQQILEPALTKVVGGITKLIEAFLNMSPVGQKMVVIFAGMVAALGPLLLIAGTVITTMVKLRIAIQFLGPAFMGTIGTIALVVAAFYALVAVFMIAYTKSEKFRNFIDNLAPAIKKGLGVAVEWTAEKLKVLWEWLQKATEKVKEFGSAISSKVANTLQQFGINLGQAGSSIGSFISSGLERLGGAFGKVGGVMSIAASVLTKVGLAFFGITGPLGLVISLVVSFLTAWARTGELNADGITQVFDNLTSTIQGAADAINQYLPIFVQKGTEILVKLIEGIANAIPGVVSVISQVIESLVQTISTVLPTILAAGVQILTALINGIAQALPTIIQAAIQIIMALFNGLIQALPTIISAAIQIIQALIQGLVEALPAIIEAALQIITGLVQGLIQALPMILEAALQIIMGLVNALIENIGPILEAGIQILMALIQGLIQMIPELIVAAIEIITTLLTSILSNLPQLLEAGVKLLLALIQGLIQMIPQLLAGAIQIMMALLKAIVDYVPKLLQAGVQLLQALIQGIASLIGSLVSTIASMMGQVVSKIASFLGQMLSGGANLIRNLISGIGSMIGSVVGKISSMGSSMISSITGFAGQMVSAGVNLVQGFINGIGSMVSSAVNAAANMASSALNAVKGFLGIHSPSRVMEKMGVYTGQGFVNGIGNMIRTTRDKAIEMASTVTEALSDVKMNIQENGVVQKVKDVFEQIVDEMPDELPKPGFGKVLDAIRTPEVDLYGNKDKDPDKPQGGGASGGKDHTTITIGTIVVRNNDDVDKLSRGLYNKSKETLSGFGNIVTS